MQFFKTITEAKYFKIFLLGITSGMPFAILYTTIGAWMNDFEIDFKLVATIAGAKLPYSLKFIWAPFIDYFGIPILGRFVGNKRSWMILSSLCISGILYYMSDVAPNDANFHKLFILSVCIGFCAATYDIAYDGLRISSLTKEEQGIAVAHVTLAYRIGIILTGACALKYAHDYGWQSTFIFLSSLFIAATIMTLLVRLEPNISATKDNFVESTYRSFKDLVNKKYFVFILSTIMLYKLGDAMLACVGMKFYTVVGFSKAEIAYVVKTCGLIATIMGAYLGGFIMTQCSQMKGLMICGVAQMVTNLGYIWLHHAGYDITIFLITNICENFTGGMGAAAMSTYISSLCNIRFAANQFALLCSCSTLINNSLTASAGVFVEQMGWDNYFIFTTVISLPSLMMLYILNKKLNQE